MNRRATLSFALGMLLAGVPVAMSLARADATPPLFDPATGYRISRYRAPVDAPAPAGVTRVDADTVEAMARSGEAVLVDVLPSDGAGWDEAARTWRLAHEHKDIPGSTWLPDVGFGAPLPQSVAYFRANLDRLTKGDRSRPIVIYCQADCWMSWNASRRAVAFGYTKVLWFPEGVDGWRDFDRPFQPADPVPLTPAP